MLEKFIYTNSFNEKLEFGTDCFFVNQNDLRDFAWEVTTKNDKISSFRKGIAEKTIPVILKCSSEEEGYAMRNRLFEVCEKDVLVKKHGKIQIGDYYLRCYITGSAKEQYLLHKGYMFWTLTVQTDLPEWVKETTWVYNVDSISEDVHLDFEYDYPHDFKNELMNRRIHNTAIIDSNFIITIFGAVNNPSLYIGGHEYSVNVDVGEGEYLTIDSVNKTIVLSKANGEQVNCFNARNKDSYIFEKIPSGINVITSPNEKIFFNITLLEERSEPKWI